MKKSVHLIAMLLLLGAINGCQTFNVSEKSFLKPDRPITQTLLDELGNHQRLQKIQINTADGVMLSGSIIKTPNAKFTLIYFGGNMFRINAQGADIARDLGSFENNLVLVDHRGYGLSEGIPTVENLERDAITIFDFVSTHAETRDLPIIVHGLSLGSMIAGSLSNHRILSGLVLEGSTTSPKAMIDAIMPWYIMPLVKVEIDPSLQKIDNSQRLAHYSGPLLILVGENDSQTPPSLSKTLYQQAKSINKKLLVMPGKGHGNVTSHEDFKEQYQLFINRALLN